MKIGKLKFKEKDYAWVIAYIDSTFLERVESDLKRAQEYKFVEAYIPTVKVLKKTFKGQEHFEEVPLLFNYGFFKIPRKFAVLPGFLEDMKANIACIYGWVKDPGKVVPRKPRLRDDKKSVYADNEIMVATATSKEIANLVKDSFKYSDHAAEDLDAIQPGTIITLRRYPWEGVQAEVVSIDPRKKEVTIKINIFTNMREVRVSFNHVFYTIYSNRGWDDSLTIKDSLDYMDEKGTLDKNLYKNQKNGDQ